MKIANAELEEMIESLRARESSSSTFLNTLTRLSLSEALIRQ